MRADKSKIVYEAVNRIQKLQNTFNKLESQKLERLEENNILLMGLQKVGKIGGRSMRVIMDQPVILQLLYKLIMVLVPLFQLVL